MSEKTISSRELIAFHKYLAREEKSPITIEKYLRDAGTFVQFANGREVTKELTVAYKNSLVEKNYAVRSINSMLASVNSLLTFLPMKNFQCTISSFMYLCSTSMITRNGRCIIAM